MSVRWIVSALVLLVSARAMAQGDPWTSYEYVDWDSADDPDVWDDDWDDEAQWEDQRDWVHHGEGAWDPQRELDGETYHRVLDPHGHWEHHQGLGWVWVPHRVAPTWRPYTRGHWVYTDYGWTWVSDWDWGWVTFHYGRWTVLGGRWVWVPGSRWAPAWVAWRSHDEVVGWAPLPPGVSVGATVEIGPRHWVFVPAARLGVATLGAYYYPTDRVVHYYRVSRPVTVVHRPWRWGWYAGPRRVWVERRWRRPVHVVRYRPRGWRRAYRPVGHRAYRPAPRRAYRPASRRAYRPAPRRARKVKVQRQRRARPGRHMGRQPVKRKRPPRKPARKGRGRPRRI